MVWVAEKTLSEFREQIERMLPVDADQREYMNTVGLAVREFRKAHIKPRSGQTLHQALTEWMQLCVGWDTADTENKKLTDHNVKNLVKKDSSFLRATAVHYRLHMELGERLNFARTIDKSVYPDDLPPWLDQIFTSVSSSDDSFDDPYASFPALTPDQIRNFDKGLVTLEGIGWTQAPVDATERDLQIELYANVLSCKFGEFALSYGLQQMNFRVEAEDGKITKYYKGSEHDLKEHVHYLSCGEWEVSVCEAIEDIDELMSGSIASGPICRVSASPNSKTRVIIEAYAAQHHGDLKIRDAETGDLIAKDNKEKRDIIRKTFLIYIQERQRMPHDLLVLARGYQSNE